MMPAAPARFSTTTGCPHLARSLSASRRATRSSPPPAAAGTVMLTGFDGYSCPYAGTATAARSSRTFLKRIIPSGFRKGALFERLADFTALGIDVHVDYTGRAAPHTRDASAHGVGQILGPLYRTDTHDALSLGEPRD